MNIKDIVKVKSCSKYKELENRYGVVVSAGEKQGHWLVAFLDVDKNKALPLTEIKEEDLFWVIQSVDINGKQVCYLDQVELVSDKYQDKGIQKGQVGVVMEIQLHVDKVLVDFTSVDKKLNVTGDCILVSCEHLKVL